MVGDWIRGVRTVSTYPPPGLYTRPADEIARVMARKTVSPLGLGSAIRMVQYHINRGGRTLKPAHRTALEEAKHILQEWRAEGRAPEATAEEITAHYRMVVLNHADYSRTRVRDFTAVAEGARIAAVIRAGCRDDVEVVQDAVAYLIQDVEPSGEGVLMSTHFGHGYVWMTARG